MAHTQSNPPTHSTEHHYNPATGRAASQAPAPCLISAHNVQSQAKPIMSAAPGSTPAASIPASTISVPAQFMARLRAQFLQGKLCDTIVRSVVQPDPEEQEQDSSSKKRKATDAPCRPLRSSSRQRQQGKEREHAEDEEDGDGIVNQGSAATSAPPQPRKTDILCHAVVLCARSPYFESSLSGEWNEAQTKTVEIVLENDQAVQDMKLLIKLCYSGSYTKEGGEGLIDRSTRMRLAFLGNAFEMEDCVSECLASLADDLAPSNVLTILDDVPEELRGHETMKGVTAKVIEVLADTLNTITQSDPPTASETRKKQELGDALAKALGPVNHFWGQSICAKDLGCLDTTYDTCLPLKTHILALPSKAMEALLACDTLQVTTENEVYTLLGCWLYQSPHAGAYDGIRAVKTARCLPLFRRLVKLVRHHHLSPEYLAGVVSVCPLAAESGLLPYMLCLSLTNRKAEEPWGNPAVKDRGRGSRSYTLTSTFDLADILTLAPEESLCKYVGLIDGYPTAFQIERHVEKERTDFAIFVYPLVPAWETETWEDGPRVSLDLEFTLRVGKVQKACQHVFDKDLSWGRTNFFNKSWEQTVYEGSNHFPDGQIKIEVRAWFSEEAEN